MSKVNKILSRSRDASEHSHSQSQADDLLSQPTGSSSQFLVPTPKLAILKRAETASQGSASASSTSLRPSSSSLMPSNLASNQSKFYNLITACSDKNTTNTERKPQILQRTGTPSSESDANNRGIAGMSLYDILKNYEFPYNHAVPLVHNDLNFENNTDFLKPMRGTTDFLVVTIIGPPGSGKSTILNYLAGQSTRMDFLEEPQIFLPRKENNEEKISSFYISSQNIIFIEMASVFNGSAALEFIPIIDKFSTLETMTTSWNLRLARWALSVSHVVLVLSSNLIEPKIFQLLNSASTLRPMESIFGETCHPELIFIANKCQASDFAKEQFLAICNTGDILGFGRRARVNPNAFLLPHHKNKDSGNNSFEKFRRKIYEFNYWNRAPFTEDKINGQNKILQTLTIDDWFALSSNLWNEMNNSSFFHEYAGNIRVYCVHEMKLKGENFAVAVVGLEWAATITVTIGLIISLKQINDNSQIAISLGVEQTTLLVWCSIFAVAYFILCIFLSILLTNGVNKKCKRHLSLWIIIEYIVFVLSFIIVIGNLVGYLSFGWVGISLLVSLPYRFFILKVISEFNQEITLEEDRERRKSMPQLPQPESSAPKLSQYNLHLHQQQHAQYIKLPQQPYSEPDYVVPRSVPLNVEPAMSVQTYQHHYHPQPPPFPPRLGRSYSESTV